MRTQAKSASVVDKPMNTATQNELVQKPGRKSNIRDFMAASTDITEWMLQAHQPFLGFISKGVREKYIDPLRKRHEEGTVDGRIYDIAWMSSGRPFGFSGGGAEGLKREIDGIPKDRVSTFTLLMGGRYVKLCKVYNAADFHCRATACLIMLQEEAENFDPDWHFPSRSEGAQDPTTNKVAE